MPDEHPSKQEAAPTQDAAAVRGRSAVRSGPTPAWKSALIGLSIGVGVVLATAPIGLYMAIGRDGEIKPGAIAIGVLWLVVLSVSTVGGAVAPKLLSGVEARARTDAKAADEA
ncbi:MAG: hypothetical protein AAF108_05165 [Planctomycetota bacterium]